MIEKFKVTDASVHDSNIVEDLVDETNQNKDLYGDSAYSGERIENILEGKSINNCINEKGARYVKLTEEQSAEGGQNNRQKSKVRVRIEHVFGFMEKAMKGSYIYTIGIKRATAAIGLMNLTYNFFRYIHLVTA